MVAAGEIPAGQRRLHARCRWRCTHSPVPRPGPGLCPTRYWQRRHPATSPTSVPGWPAPACLIRRRRGRVAPCPSSLSSGEPLPISRSICGMPRSRLRSNSRQAAASAAKIELDRRRASPLIRSSRVLAARAGPGKPRLVASSGHAGGVRGRAATDLRRAGTVAVRDAARTTSRSRPPAGGHRARRLPRPGGACPRRRAVVVGVRRFFGSLPGCVGAAQPARPAPAISRSESAAPSPRQTAARVPSATRVLAELDGVRSAAFAARDPSRLAGVYASSQLLARDRAQLLAIVPPGCELKGVSTRYSHVVVTSRSARGMTLRANATLPPSRLVCGGTPSGRAPGLGPARLQVRIVRLGAQYRIADQRRI